jgi:signal transduction histidine kinase
MEQPSYQCVIIPQKSHSWWYSFRGAGQAEISVEGTERQLPLETCTHLFRIAQEGLANVRHHSEATEVNVRLEYLQETVRLSIKDNGKGFLLPDINTFARRGKLGLMSMQERARLINGALKIDSKLWKGTSISLECPG